MILLSRKRQKARTFGSFDESSEQLTIERHFRDKKIKGIDTSRDQSRSYTWDGRRRRKRLNRVGYLM
jgi:hypothetical protein